MTRSTRLTDEVDENVEINEVDEDNEVDEVEVDKAGRRVRRGW